MTDLQSDYLRDKKYEIFIENFGDIISDWFGEDNEELCEVIFDDELNWNNGDVYSGQYVFSREEISDLIEMYYEQRGGRK